MKRKHPAHLNPIIETEEQLDSDLLAAGPSTSSNSLSGHSSSTTSIHQSCISPIPKRPRQLKLFGSTRGNELSEVEKSSIDKSLIKMISVDYQPLSLVENIGFLEYSEKLQPLYKPPSRKTLTMKLLPEEYNKIATILKSMLKSINNVSITTDIWTSDSNRAYLTVTCHFIFNDCLYSPVLATREMIKTHTGANIASSISDILIEWGILDKIVTIVSDNGSNIKNAINEHLHKYHHPCVAHTLNLIVNDVITSNEELLNVIKKCRALVGHFKHSVFASTKLKEIQNQMNLPDLKVKQDVPTRWNSSLLMLERLIQIKAPLSAAITFLPRAPNFLTALEWELISDCLPLLKPFEIMTVELSGENYPTLSIVIPLIRGLQYTLRNKTTTTTAGDLLKKTAIDVIARRLGILECNKIVAKATFLDPRFKKAGFGLMDNANNTEKWITDEINSIMRNTREEETSNMPINEEPNLLWEHFDNKVSQIRTTVSTGISASLLIRQYLEMPYLNRSKNPLDFWKQHKNTFPELYTLQLKYLCVPATSVPSERVFSKSGQITNDRRNRLHPKNLDYIVFLNSNLNLTL